MLLMTAAMTIGFAACSDDDDNNTDGVPFGGGNPSITVNGITFSGSYAFFNIDTANETDTFYELWISNSNYPSINDPLVNISIVYRVTGGSTTQIATGEFDNFQVSLSSIGSDDSKDRMFSAFNKSDGNDAKLKVSKSGSNISIEVPALNYTQIYPTPETTTTYPGGACSYSGSIKQMPEQNLEK